jgi:hypothetical protein
MNTLRIPTFINVHYFIIMSFPVNHNVQIESHYKVCCDVTLKVVSYQHYHLERKLCVVR